MNPIKIKKILHLLTRKAKILIERFKGVDFSSVSSAKKTGVDESIAFRGSPSGDLYLTAVLKDLGITDQDSILDIGCSKGSALNCMTQFPFKNIHGIELSEYLANIAIKNFHKIGKSNISIFNIDARYFNQYAKYNFFYFYNPFPEKIMADVIKKICLQISMLNESIIIYNNPTCHNLIEASGFVKITEYPDFWGNGIYIYSNKKL